MKDITIIAIAFLLVAGQAFAQTNKSDKMKQLNLWLRLRLVARWVWFGDTATI